MAKSIGKVFEEEIKASIPDGFYVERYKDDTAGFYGVTNPADYRLYREPYLFLWELKTHKGKSLPLAKIRLNQIKGMCKADMYTGIFAGFIINFRDLAETYYVPVWRVVQDFYTVGADGEIDGISPTGRKSIPVSWCKVNGTKIEQEKKRVRYTYNLKEFFKRWY
jgi:recombination protein U